MIIKTSMRRNCRAASLPAVSFASVAAIVLTVSIQAHADVYWNLSGQPGDWSVAQNWQGGLPTTSDTAFVVNGGTATITMPGEVCGAFRWAAVREAERCK